jgi:hypothetical protein
VNKSGANATMSVKTVLFVKMANVLSSQEETAMYRQQHVK